MNELVGPWLRVSLCAHCGFELSRQAIFDRKICPNCAATSKICLSTMTTAKRWVLDFKPSFWQKCRGKRPIGHWEWSGKSDSGPDIHDVTGRVPGRQIASGMNTVSIAAAGVASGLF